MAEGVAVEIDHRTCKGRCAECRWLGTLSRHEFMAWFASKYGEQFCPNAYHLTGSYDHARQCEEVA